MGTFLTRLLAVWLVLIVVGCSEKTILWEDCVIFAANARAVKDAQQALDPTYRSNVLLVETKGQPVGHAWLVFQLGEKLCAYDATGTRIVNLPPENFENYPAGVALQLVGTDLAVAKFAFKPK